MFSSAGNTLLAGLATHSAWQPVWQGNPYNPVESVASAPFHKNQTPKGARASGKPVANKRAVGHNSPQLL